MTDDHAKLREMRQEIERQEAEREAQEPSPAPSDDSEHAQENLDRMLETGEENPIS